MEVLKKVAINSLTVIALAPLLPVFVLMWACYLVEEEEVVHADVLSSKALGLERLKIVDGSLFNPLDSVC